MEVRSLGFQTDLMVRRLAGSTVTEHAHHLVVRTPRNPWFHWGNFLLLDAAPGRESIEGWIARFRGEFPEAEHVTLGIDGTEFPGPQSYPSSVGLEVDLGVVLTRRRPPEPDARRVAASPPDGLAVRRLRAGADWEEELRLREEEGADEEPPPTHHHEYLVRRTAEAAALVRGGRVEYFGAFDGDRLCSVVGIASDGGGVARFQNVATRPDYRNRGWASHLVVVAGEFATKAMGATLLVIVADHGSAAARLYGSLGFSPTEAQLGLSTSTGPDPEGSRAPRARSTEAP